MGSAPTIIEVRIRNIDKSIQEESKPTEEGTAEKPLGKTTLKTEEIKPIMPKRIENEITITHDFTDKGYSIFTYNGENKKFNVYLLNRNNKKT